MFLLTTNTLLVRHWNANFAKNNIPSFILFITAIMLGNRLISWLSRIMAAINKFKKHEVFDFYCSAHVKMWFPKQKIYSMEHGWRYITYFPPFSSLWCFLILNIQVRFVSSNTTSDCCLECNEDLSLSFIFF